MLFELARRSIFKHDGAPAFMKRSLQNDTAISPLATFSLAAVTGAGILAFIFLAYMLQQVLTTLCMIETPTAAITVSASAQSPTNKEEAEKQTLLDDGPVITLVHQKPITSSIRGTIRHLVANGGRFARFRGYAGYVIYYAALHFVANFLNLALRIPNIFAVAIAGALLANVHAAWTHKIISMPHDKSFFHTIPPRSAWRQLALPSAIKSAMPILTVYIAVGLAFVLRILDAESNEIRDYTAAQWTSYLARWIAVALASLAVFLFLYLPAAVTLVRIEASLLPEAHDYIVPFDRSFGGKVVPTALGGTGKVGFLDAWRSFGWEARKRLVGLYVKGQAVMVAYVIVAVHIVLLVAMVTMGTDLPRLFAPLRK